MVLTHSQLNCGMVVMFNFPVFLFNLVLFPFVVVHFITIFGRKCFWLLCTFCPCSWSSYTLVGGILTFLRLFCKMSGMLMFIETYAVNSCVFWCDDSITVGDVRMAAVFRSVSSMTWRAVCVIQVVFTLYSLSIVIRCLHQSRGMSLSLVLILK